MVCLTPVLEFDPGLFRSGDHAYPDAVFGEDPEGWQAYRRLCWADAGLFNLKTYCGSEFVRFDEVDAHALAILLHHHLELSETVSLDLDEVSSLAGGYVLELDCDQKIWPRCCGSLEDWHSWAAAWAMPMNETIDLWIGHPALTVRSTGPQHIQICEQQEFGMPEHPRQFTVDRTELGKAVRDIQGQLARFEVRIADALLGHGVAQNESVAAILTGGLSDGLGDGLSNGLALD